jgi:hypothetical protein
MDVSEESKLLKVSYICAKCGTLCMTDSDKVGTKCDMNMKKPCDGLYRRMTSADIDYLVGKTTEAK